MQNPSIYFGTFEFREPVTTLTDIIVGVTCLFFVVWLNRRKKSASSTFTFYKNYLLIFSFGIICGGILGHGLQAYISPSWKMVGWILSLIGQVYLVLASLKQLDGIINSKIQKLLLRFTITSLVIASVLILLPITRHFIITQITSTILVLGITLPLQAFHYVKTKSKGSLLMCYGILVLLIPAVVFNFNFNLGKWFNAMDIAHVFMNISVVLMFFGIKQLALTTNKK